MRLLRRLFPDKRIRPVRMLVVPRNAASELLHALQPILSDFDEPLTTSVRGPYLIPADWLPPDLHDRLRDDGIAEQDGYAVTLGPRTDLLDQVPGDFCAFYERETVCTLDRSTAKALLQRLSSPDWPENSSPDNPHSKPMPWWRIALQRYRDKFNTELGMLFPLAAVFALLSVYTFWISLRLYLSDPAYLALFLWSLVPLIVYSFIVFLCLFKTHLVSRLFEFQPDRVPSSEDLRRSRYTQSLLGVVLLLASYGAFDSLAWWFLDNTWAEDGLRLFLSAFLATISAVFLLLWNRKYPVAPVRAAFILLLLLVFAFTDNPAETVAGRSLVFQIVPGMIASFTLAPPASFYVAVISILILGARGSAAGLDPNSTAYLGLLLTAFVSWLISHGWERAYREVERMNAELEIKVADRTRQLAEANKFKSQFLAQISHELQSPIVAFSLFVKRYRPLLESRETIAIENETRRVLEMAKSISTVSKIELDILEDRVVSHPIEILGVIDRQVDVLAMRAEEKGLALRHERPAGDLLIWGNRNYLVRIIDNLLTNAIKYSESGREVVVRSRVDGETLICEVIDHGIGIPQKEIDHVFERFARASNVGDRPGSGLGLSMVRDMVEALNGSISIESAIGQGTTVTLRFPRIPTP